MSDAIVSLLTVVLGGGLLGGLAALFRLRADTSATSVATAERLVTMLERDLERARARADAAEEEVARLRAEVARLLAGHPGFNSNH